MRQLPHGLGGVAGGGPVAESVAMVTMHMVFGELWLVYVVVVGYWVPGGVTPVWSFGDSGPF